jgi:phosphatidate phosphatase LPIN
VCRMGLFSTSLTKIVRSDALGHVFNLIGRDWTHLGVAKLYTDICKNGFRIMYLTSRAIGQADSTRYYLQGIKQNDYQLPEGPVIMSPDRLMASLHRWAGYIRIAITWTDDALLNDAGR